MRKKGIFIVLLSIILFLVSSQLVLAQDNANQSLTGYEKAYACLENKVQGKCSTLSSEEQAFSLLALAYNSNIQSECKSALLSSSNNGECWPSSCNIKTTAIAMLALNNIQQDTTSVENWLLSHKIKTKDLEWYLEIDSSEKTECKISYDGSDHTITIKEDKKISGNAGNCFSLSHDNYWLKIKDDCLEKNFTISCDKDFISTLLYKKKGSDVWHVSSNVESASGGGMTQHQVKSYCFSNDGNTCDYEGSLWSVLALQKAGYDINQFLPYLIAFSKDNKKYLPASFLYYLTNSDDYLSEVLEEQKTSGYWNVGNDKFYDTAVALLSISGISSEAMDSAEDWLFKNQDTEGCWNSRNKIRDTAFILWAGWPKPPVISSGGNVVYCEEDMGYYCVSRGACEDAEGEVLENYYCRGTKVCCSKQPQEETCEERGGVVCSAGEECSVSTVEIRGEECCIGGTCQPIQTKTECEEYGYYCRDECFSDEEETDYECDLGKVCCKEKPQQSSNKALIWILIILILIIILAIILRDKIKLFFFKRKNKFRRGPAPISRPPFPPTPPTATPPMQQRYPPLRVIPPQQPTQQIRQPRRPVRQNNLKDKDFEETMKKLRELGR